VLFSDDNQHSVSPVSLRAAFATLPQYHHNTCPANLAAAGDVTSSSPAAARDEVIFEVPALAEEILLDVSHIQLLSYCFSVIIYYILISLIIEQ